MQLWMHHHIIIIAMNEHRRSGICVTLSICGVLLLTKCRNCAKFLGGDEMLFIIWVGDC